jgi:hypothetical protein
VQSVYKQIYPATYPVVSASQAGGIAVDANGGIYQGFQRNYDGPIYGCVSSYAPAIQKVSAAGATYNWGKYINSFQDVPHISDSLLVDDANGYVYQGGTTTPGSRIGFVAQYDMATGVRNWRRETGGTTITDLRGGSITMDGSGNIYLALSTGRADNTTIHKFNSSGVIQWAKSLANTSIVGIKYNSTDGYLYALAAKNITNAGFVIYKFDTSGTVDWQRNLRISAGGTVTSSIDDANYGYGYQPLAISSAGKLFVTAQFRNSSTGIVKTFVANLPTDGSLTGTYTNLGGYSVTYETGSGSSFVNASTAGSLNTNTNVAANATSTSQVTEVPNIITNASYSTTKGILN